MVFKDQLKRLSLMKLKIGIHGVQAVLTVICWILMIAIIAKNPEAGSPTYWLFSLTWLTFVALAYQGLVPLWERTRRFRNIYAGLAIDALFALFWLAAFAALQAWVAKRLPNPSQGYCKGFEPKDGGDDRCAQSNGAVILGVIMFLLFLVTSGLSFYKVWIFRKTGYLHCITKKPSISAPVQPRFVYPEPSNFSDPEKAPVITVSHDGEAPQGRKPSWGVLAPSSAPATAPNFPEAKPSFREIQYNAPVPTERSPLAQYAPISRRPVTNQHMPAPKLQLYGPGDRSPALVMDYGATTPYLPPQQQQDPYAQSSLRYSQHRPYPVTPAQHYPPPFQPQNPYQPPYASNPYYQQPGSHQSFINNSGYRPNYGSGLPQGYNQDPYSQAFAASGGRRQSRTAGPGPASRHQGGHHSAFHTPLPDAMASPTNQGYHRYKRESTVQFYSQQQAFERPDRYGR